MALDRQNTGPAILRICIGLFFVFEAIGKIRWVTNASLLGDQLSGWSKAASAGSISQWYLQTVALPGVAYFARLVPLGEISSGLAMILGFWTPFAAFIAFFMALNFLIASGAIFKYSFLTNGYGLPVLGSTLALVFSGSRGKMKNLKLKREKS
jgi:uncharacterized membrane protein YphA (DoxX/SURF4 family)